MDLRVKFAIDFIGTESARLKPSLLQVLTLFQRKIISLCGWKPESEYTISRLYLKVTGSSARRMHCETKGFAWADYSHAKGCSVFLQRQDSATLLSLPSSPESFIILSYGSLMFIYLLNCTLSLNPEKDLARRSYLLILASQVGWIRQPADPGDGSHHFTSCFPDPTLASPGAFQIGWIRWLAGPGVSQVGWIWWLAGPRVS